MKDRLESSKSIPYHTYPVLVPQPFWVLVFSMIAIYGENMSGQDKAFLVKTYPITPPHPKVGILHNLRWRNCLVNVVNLNFLMLSFTPYPKSKNKNKTFIMFLSNFHPHGSTCFSNMSFLFIAKEVNCQFLSINHCDNDKILDTFRS